MKTLGTRELQLRAMREQRSKPTKGKTMLTTTPATGKLAVGDKISYPDGTTGKVISVFPVPGTKKPAKAAKRAKPKKAKAKPAKKKAAKRAAKPAKKKDSPARAIRPGSKLELIVGLLKRPEGCTRGDVMTACNWPSVSLNQQAEAAGLKLRVEKIDGTKRYYVA